MRGGIGGRQSACYGCGCAQLHANAPVSLRALPSPKYRGSSRVHGFHGADGRARSSAFELRQARDCVANRLASDAGGFLASLSRSSTASAGSRRARTRVGLLGAPRQWLEFSLPVLGQLTVSGAPGAPLLGSGRATARKRPSDGRLLDGNSFCQCYAASDCDSLSIPEVKDLVRDSALTIGRARASAT
jgi:hypothetical protein